MVHFDNTVHQPNPHTYEYEETAREIHVVSHRLKRKMAQCLLLVSGQRHRGDEARAYLVIGSCQ